MPAQSTAKLLSSDENDAVVAFLLAGLTEAGYHCESIYQAGPLDMSVAMGSATPDLLVLSTDRLDKGLLQQLLELDNHNPCPIVLSVREHDSSLLAQAFEMGASTYLLGHCIDQPASLLAELAVLRFVDRQKLKAVVEDARKQLRDRKLVERAKGILMQTKNLTEPDAYRVMRQAAMNRAQPLVQVAAGVIQVAELLDA